MHGDATGYLYRGRPSNFHKLLLAMLPQLFLLSIRTTFRKHFQHFRPSTFPVLINRVRARTFFPITSNSNANISLKHNPSC